MVDVPDDLQVLQALVPTMTSTRGRRSQFGAGTSSGINIAPGSDDDGWIVPPPVKLADGTHIQLFKDGEALHAAYDAIKQATRRICLEVYIFADDDTGRAFADLLCEKARQGVKVFVIYDSFGSFYTSALLFDRLKRNGVHVEVFHPIKPWECRYSWRPANRDHRKLLVIDDHIAGMGGLNIGREYAGSWIVPANDQHEADFWRDNAIGISGPSAKFFFQAFARSWHYVTHGGRIRRAELVHNIDPLRGRFARRRIAPTLQPHDERPQCSDLGLLASVPTLSSPLAPMLHAVIRTASKSILLTTAYFAPSDGLIDELCAAAKRGVKVRLMLPARGDVKLLVIAARSFYEKLMCAGVEIFERQSVVLHAKTMVLDQCVTVMGSTNLDYRSIEYNCELTTLIRSEEFGRQMGDLFENDVRYAKRISLREWRRRPGRDRLVQWAVNRSRYIL